MEDKRTCWTGGRKVSCLRSRKACELYGSRISIGTTVLLQVRRHGGIEAAERQLWKGGGGRTYGGEPPHSHCGGHGVLQVVCPSLTDQKVCVVGRCATQRLVLQVGNTACGNEAIGLG